MLLPFSLAWAASPAPPLPTALSAPRSGTGTEASSLAPGAFRTWVLRQHATGRDDVLAIVYPSEGDGEHLPPHLHRALAVLVAPEATLDGLGTRFDRPLYAAEALHVPAYTTLASAYAEGTVTLGDGTRVLRWLSGQCVEVGAGCVLGGPVQSHERITLGAATIFTHLQAPLLQFGPGAMPAASSPTDAPEWTPPRAVRLDEHTLLVRDHLDVPPGVVVRASLLATGHARLGAGSRVLGRFKGVRGVHVERGAFVRGGVHSERSLYLADGVRVRGALFTAGDALVGRGCVIGTPSEPVTVTAPRLRIGLGTTVYGTVCASEHGEVS